ncbi:MAG TPA: PAS domain-containing protein, partial [Syntrophorhabdaceae bacterium]|nr:PAS domain-containing protein [Syntrophorhabdaceae bacterium]
MPHPDKSTEELLHELSTLCSQVTELEEEKLLWKRTDDALAEEKNKLQALVDSLEYGITIQDRDYNIIFQNKTLQDMFGHIGDKCYRTYEFSEKVCEGCPAELVFLNGTPHSSERRVLMPSGETIIWENTATPLRDAGGNITGCI